MSHFSNKQINHGKKLSSRTKAADVVVVGAGMAGLYSTWRLLNETEDNDDIVILERSNRTGGRLDSDLIQFSDGDVVKEEEGGMRFLFEGMDDLMALFMTLGIQNDIVPFPMNSGGNNRLYFRGEGFDVNQASKDDYAVWDKLYNLAPAERGINPKEIINTVFNRILQANPHFDPRPEHRDPEFWQSFRLDCKWNDIPLNEWSLWDLYSDMGYSNECITLLYRLLGFNGTFLSKMNAGVAYQLLEDFPADAKFRTLKDGFSTLPNKLVEEIGQERIYLETSVEGIDQIEGQDSYTITYRQGEDYGTITAKKVILALPRLALEKLFVKSNAFNRLPQEESQALWDTLQSTSNQPLLKINLYYDNAWWGNGISGRPSVEFGPNFADLPTGSVYPFYSIDKQVIAGIEYSERVEDPSEEQQAKLDEIAKSKYKKPAALTIYCDYLNINFWSGLQNNGELFDSEMQQKYSGGEDQNIFPASKAVVRQATEFFKQIFDTHYVPEPVMTSARIWEGSVKFDIDRSQQFGFGVHQWAVGADDRKVMKALVEPLPNIYTCGEAFSDYQGWVEGALRSTDLVMKQGFGLQPFSEVYEERTGKSSSVVISKAYYDNTTKMITDYVDPKYVPSKHDKGQKGIDLEVCLGIKLSYLD